MRRHVAAVGALMLISSAIFGGALTASASPLDPPTITTPASGQSSQAQPTVEGVVQEEGLTVTVMVTNAGSTSTYCVDSSPSGERNFSCTGDTALEYGMNDFTAFTRYTFGTPDAMNGPASNTVGFELYGTQPTIITTAPAGNSTDPTPTFGGTGPSLGSVDIQESSSVVCSTTVAPDGSWSCSPPPFETGNHTEMGAVGTDLGGASTFAGSEDFTVEPPPAPTVDQSFTPWVTSSATRSIQGNKDSNVSYIQVYVSPDGEGSWAPYCQTSGTILGATVWFCDEPIGSLQPGMNYVAAAGFSENGDSSDLGPSAAIERVAQPTITGPDDAIFTNSSTQTLTGSSPFGSMVTIYDRPSESTLCSTEIEDGVFSCTAELADGHYNYFANVSPGDSVSSVDRTITVDTLAPALPSITGPGAVAGPQLRETLSDQSPTISGTGEPYATITLRVDGIVVGCSAGPAVVTVGGTWSCSLASQLPLGSHNISSSQMDRAGNDSSVSATQLTLTIIPVPASTSRPPTPPTATPTVAPTVAPPMRWTLQSLRDTFQPGDETDLSGAGLPIGATVEAELHSTPVNIGSTVVDAAGAFMLHVTIPMTTTPGAHEFVVTVTPVGGVPSESTQQITVVAAQRGSASAPEKPVLLAGAQDARAGATGNARDDPGAPSSFTHALDSVGQVLSNPVALGTAAAAGLALLLFVAFPAELLNSTLSEQYERISRGLPRVRAPWFSRLRGWLATTPLFGGVGIILLASLIFGFADPGFGFDITSLRVVLACAIALFIVGYLASVISGRILGRRWHLDTELALKPLGLILTVVGVVLSRLLDFSPGFLIGLILGLGLVGKTTIPERAKATLVQSGVVFTLAILGWLGYSILIGSVPSNTFGGALLFDTLVAVTSGGLTALLVGLLPLRFLGGESIFSFSKPIWLAVWLVTAFAFIAAVVPSAGNWGKVAIALPLWIAIVGAFFVVAIAIYLYFRFWARPLATEPDEPQGQVSVTSNNESA